MLFVFAGGVIGTATREAIVLGTPEGMHERWAILAINVAGAFLLGLLVARLSAGAENARRRGIRFFVGVGMLGGFTTYSALAVDIAGRLGDEPSQSLVYGIISVGAGVLGAALGLAAGRRPASPDRRESR